MSKFKFTSIFLNAIIILGDKMKKFIIFVCLVLVLGLCYFYRENIMLFYYDKFVYANKNVDPPKKNSYYRDYDFEFVKNTDTFSPNNYQDLLNIYYTVLNSGVDEFSFFCPKNYEDCLSEVDSLANDNTTLSNINNFVHPYNSFSDIKTRYNDLGKVTIEINKVYSKEKIKEINTKIEQILNKIKLTNDSQENIKSIHDYIINTSKYDTDRSDNNIANYDSDTAYGNLLQGYGLCGGYADSMELFLEQLHIKSFKVASDNHIWNAVNLNKKWYHLDLTWDDPVSKNKQDILEYNFFMITTDELKELKTNQHNYDKNVYKEI